MPAYPLRPDRQRRFRWDTRNTRQEEGFAVEDFLVGRVASRSIVGRYEYSRRFSLPHRRESAAPASTRRARVKRK